MHALRCVVAVTLLVVGCAVSPAHAQVITFAQISAPHLFSAMNGRPGSTAARDTLQNRLAFLEAIVTINGLAQAGRPLSFVVVSGDLDVATIDSAEVGIRASDLAGILGALLTPRIVILPGESDVAGNDPRARARFDQFVDQVRRSLAPERELVDLTRRTVDVDGIRVVGLDTLPFAAVAGQMPAERDQVRELERVRQAIGAAKSSIIFMHTPPVEAPLIQGGKPVPLWKLASPARQPLRQLVNLPALTAIFAGHIESGDSDFFARPHVMAPKALERDAAPRVWVAPSVGQSSRFPRSARPRGFLIATVTADGDVTPTVHWLQDRSGAARDKEALLAKASAHLEVGELDQAANAYGEALASTDSSVRRAADQGFLQARRNMDTWRWRLDPITRFLRNRREILSGALLLLLVGAVWNFNRPTTVDAPVKLTTDAPAELFVAELLAAIPDAQRMLKSDHQLGPIDGREVDVSLARPLFVDGELKGLIDDLPGLGQVKAGGYVEFSLRMLGLLRRRLRIEVSGSMDDLTVFATLRRVGVTKASWRAPSEAGEKLGVTAAAQQLAYNVMWELRKK
jgi:hypothetical protein